MAGPAPLFDASPADVRATVTGEPDPPGRSGAVRLRAAMLVAVIAVGLADTAFLRQAVPARVADAAPTSRTPVSLPQAPPAPALTPPIAPPTAARTVPVETEIAFVRRYYALLPGDPGAAFGLLGPPARTQSGGFGRFSAFYRGIARISIDPTPSVVAPSTVAAVIRFQRRSGEVTHERYELVVARAPDGTAVLQSYRRA